MVRIKTCRLTRNPQLGDPVARYVVGALQMEGPNCAVPRSRGQGLFRGISTHPRLRRDGSIALIAAVRVTTRLGPGGPKPNLTAAVHVSQTARLS